MGKAHKVSLRPPERTTVGMHVEASIAEIVDRLYECGDETVLDLIKELDQRIADWDFTLKLADYFAGERKKYEQEKRKP